MVPTLFANSTHTLLKAHSGFSLLAAALANDLPSLVTVLLEFGPESLEFATSTHCMKRNNASKWEGQRRVSSHYEIAERFYLQSCPNRVY